MMVNWVRKEIIIINNNNGLIAFPHCGYSMLQKVTCIHLDLPKSLARDRARPGTARSKKGAPRTADFGKSSIHYDL
jgi:hypothetical protein